MQSRYRRQTTPIVLTGLLLVSMTAEAASRPAIVELYTSEGCSSCPPAERLLEELAQRSDILPLAFHVDYWDGLGWRDRFSLKEATQRQQDAARQLRLSTVGTPQMIVEGRTALWGASRARVEQAVKSGRTEVAMTVTRNGPELIVRTEEQAAREIFDVYVIGYLPKAVTAIGRGENAGRTITEVNVVRYVRKIGTSAHATREWSFPLHKLPGDAERVVVLFQTSSTGAIVGARSLEGQAGGKM
jgi:hypothetical protein